MGNIFEANSNGDGVVVDTYSGGEENATLVIALVIVFIAYFLHPLVEHVYEQVRAAHGERDINRNYHVEVTPMRLYAEILRGRGKHRNKFTVIRLVAVLVAVFVLASLELELSLSIQPFMIGPVSLFERPPEVLENKDTGNWIVVEESAVNAPGDLLKVEGDDNNGRALARYKVGKEIYDGKINSARWSDDPENDEDEGDKPELLFDNTTMDRGNFSCGGNTSHGAVEIRDTGSDGSLWGNHTVCENTSTTAPMIILENTDDEWFILEENGINAEFVYSVWKTARDVHDRVELVFYIVATTRMVEAIITGIVHGYQTGGDCVRILWAYSANNLEYPDSEHPRAAPFGEKPSARTVPKVSDMEYIEQGVNVDSLACASFLWLLIVFMLCCAWALRSRSRPAGRDIFDLAEVIKLVVANVSGSDIDPDDDSAVRIFVHKEGNQFVVTLEEADDTFSPHALCRSGLVLLQRLGSRLGLCSHSHSSEGVDNYDHGTDVHDPTTIPPPAAGAAATTTMSGSTDRPPRDVGTPARDIENNQDPSSGSPSSAARVPATTPPEAGAPPPGPNQQYRLCVQRFGEGRSFSDAPRGNGPAWSLTASPVASAPSSPTDPSPPIRQRVQFAENNQTRSMRLREGRDHLEMTEHSTAESSTASLFPNSIPTTPIPAGATVGVHPDETEFEVEHSAPPAVHPGAISSSSAATIDDSSDAAETKISPPDDIASAAINHNNSPVLASVHAERQAEALEAQRASRAAAAAAATAAATAATAAAAAAATAATAATAAAGAHEREQRDVPAQDTAASGTTPNRLARSKTFRIAPQSHQAAEEQAGAIAATTATAVIADDSSATPASDAAGGVGIPSSPPPSRRSLEAAPTLGPAEFNRLREASRRTVSDTDNSEGRQSPVRRQSTRRWWWRWG